MDVLVNEFIMIALITVRILVILSFTPIVSASQTPFFIRVVLAIVFAYIVRNSLGVEFNNPPTDLVSFLILLVGEALIGVIIGFYIQMVFLLLSIISEFFSTQMGLRAAQVLNPLTGVSSMVISQFFSILVMMVFLASYTLQRIFYYGITQSFYALNAGMLFQQQDSSYLGMLFYGFSKLFERSFIIAFPMFIALLIVNVGVGLLGKVAPQMNILVLGLPIQVGLGILLLIFFLPTIVHTMEGMFDDMIHMITRILKRLISI